MLPIASAAAAEAAGSGSTEDDSGVVAASRVEECSGVHGAVQGGKQVGLGGVELDAFGVDGRDEVAAVDVLAQRADRRYLRDGCDQADHDSSDNGAVIR